MHRTALCSAPFFRAGGRWGWEPEGRTKLQEEGRLKAMPRPPDPGKPTTLTSLPIC